MAYATNSFIKILIFTLYINLFDLKIKFIEDNIQKYITERISRFDYMKIVALTFQPKS